LLKTLMHIIAGGIHQLLVQKTQIYEFHD